MNKAIEMKKSKFLKTRYILFGLLLMFSGFFIYNYGIATFAFLALIMGTLSFGLNKKIADYFAFSIFTFLVVTDFTYKIDMYLNSESFSKFFANLFAVPQHRIIETLAIVLIISAIIYLSLNFIKNKK